MQPHRFPANYASSTLKTKLLKGDAVLPPSVLESYSSFSTPDEDLVPPLSYW